MNERQWWSSQVKPRLHKPHSGYLAWKLQDAFIMGLPDVLFNIPRLPSKSERLIGWMELKYDPAWPVRARTSVCVGLTSEQHRHLDIWSRHNNDPRTAVVLYGVGTDWFLFPHDSAVLVPDTNWLPDQIVKSAWLSGSGYSSLETIWAQLAQRPRFKE